MAYTLTDEDKKMAQQLASSNWQRFSQTPQTTKKEAGGLGGFLAGALPIIGGAAGSVGGTLLAPGIGTLAGGAAGSGLGEFLRQQITGEEADIGAVTREAALGAVPGGLGLASKGVKALKAGQATTRGAAGLTDAADAAKVSAASPIDLDVPAFMRQGKILGLPEATPPATLNLGRGAISSALSGQRQALIKEAAEAQQFNDLARQNIQRLAQERATQGLPLPGGGTLVRPGTAPSFASEGVELRPVPAIPEIPSRFQTPFVGQSPKRVPISSLTSYEGAPDAARVNQYKEMIQSGKDVASLKVTPDSTGAMGIEDGKHRFEAFKQLGFKDVPVEVTQQPGLVQRIGQKATKSGSGLKVGSGVGDINKLDEQAQFMAQKGFTGTPDKQLRAMSEEMGNLSKQVDDILTSKPIQVSGSKVSQNIYKASTDPNIFPDLDVSAPTVQRIMQANATKIQGITNAKDLNDYVKTINKAATQARAKLDDPKARALSPAETAALATKRVVDEQLRQIPDIAPLKQQMAQIFEVNPQVAKAAEKSFTLPFLGISMKTPMQAAKGVQSKVGAALQGGAQPKTGGFRPFVKPAIQQAGTRAASSALLGTPFVGAPQEEAPAQQPELLDENQLLDTAQQAPVQPSRSQQLFESALKYLQQTGDIKGAQAIASFAEQAASMEEATGSGSEKPLSAEAARSVSTAQAGIESIGLLQQQLTADPSVQQRSAIPGGLFGGAVGNVLGTGQYENARQQIKDVIARLRTGAAITSEEQSMFDQYVPQPFDDAATVQQKLGILQRQFQRVADRSANATSVDPSEALAGAY